MFEYIQLGMTLLSLISKAVPDAKAAAKAYGKQNGGSSNLRTFADSLGKLAGDVRDAATELESEIGG